MHSSDELDVTGVAKMDPEHKQDPQRVKIARLRFANTVSL